MKLSICGAGRQPPRLPGVASLAVTALLLASCHSDSQDSQPPVPQVAVFTTNDVLAIVAEANQVFEHALLASSGNPVMQRMQPVAAAIVAVGQSGVPALGRTFVVDSTRLPTIAYVPDDSRTGVPANRVRFVLYEANNLVSDLVYPFVENGAFEVELAAGGTGASVFLQPDQATPDFSITGTLELLAPFDVARRMGVILAERTLAGSGALFAGGTSIPFEYSDHVEFDEATLGDYVSDDRLFRATTPDGELLLDMFIYSSVRSSDSDHYSDIRVTLPGHVVQMNVRWIRGNTPLIGQVVIDGHAQLLTASINGCPSPNCFSINGVPVQAPELDQLNQFLVRLQSLSTAAYNRPRTLETLAAAAQYALASSISP